MTEDDVEELLEKAQDLQTELNDLHQQRVSKSDNADEKLVMFRKQVNLSFYFLFSVYSKFYFLFYFLFLGGGGVQQQKRSCRREKPKMSFVFFVLFQNTFKIDVFVSNMVKNVSSKKNKKDHDFRIF